MVARWMIASLLLVLASLTPRSGWAFAESDDPQTRELEHRREQQEEGTKRLRDIGRRLSAACKDTSSGKLDWIVDGDKVTMTLEVDALRKVCSAHCPSPAESAAAMHIDICAFRDDVQLARVAYAVDAFSVDQALSNIDAHVKKNEKAGARTTRPGPSVDGFLPSFAAPAAPLLPGPLGAMSTADGLTELAIRFATALGKLAIDRAN